MFDQTFVDAHAHTRRPWTVALSLAVQSLLVGVLLIIPILHPEILHPKIDVPIFVHLQRAPEIVRAEPAHSSAAPHSLAPHVFVAPTTIPNFVKRVVDTDVAPATESFYMGSAVPGAGQGSDILSSIVQSVPDAPAPRPKAQPQPSVAPATGPVRVSEGVQAARLIYGPKPPYPPLAITAHVEGRVRMQAIIAPDGTINSLQVISGPPLLINAARDAVSRWRYQPTLLSGKAVEVITEIDVNFMLGR
jgi:protein TonB